MLALIVLGGGRVRLSAPLPCLQAAATGVSLNFRHQPPSLAPPVLEPEPPITSPAVEALASHQLASTPPPPPQASAPSADSATVGKCPYSLSLAWFMAPTSSDICHKEDQWQTFYRDLSLGNSRTLFPPDVGVHWVEDPTRRAHFYFQPHIQ